MTTETPITTIAEVDSQPVTMEFLLQPGRYRLFCQDDAPVEHESAGMYIDIQVGGVGQVQ